MLEVNQQQGMPPGMPPPMGEDGKPQPLYDLSAGEYDVVVSTGPSFATQRVEAQANMAEIIRAAPEVLKVAGDLFFKNMDWPGADELAKRWAKAMGIPQEGEPPPEPPPPSPEVIANIEKDAATAEKTRAETEKIQVDTAMALAQLLPAMQAIPQIMQEMAAIKQMLAGGAPMGAMGQPPSPGGPGPMPAPPPAPPQPNGQDTGPPMIDVETLGAA
jgi:hypothetical protein